MENNLVTVVVPIYRVEQYLDKCVESIIQQTYKNLDIILVDDGSPDRCPDMCDEWERKDKRIRVIHKENGGLSDARNAGIEIAKGKYITFVDSDDYLEMEYVSYLVGLMENNKGDLSICEYYYKTGQDCVINHPLNNESVMLLTQKESLKELLKMRLFSNSAWGKLYRLDHFKDVRYPVGRLFEDTPTTYKIFLKCSKIIFGAKCLYNYLYRNDSISKQSFSDRRMDAVRFAEEMTDNILKIYPDLKPQAKCRLLDDYVDILRLLDMKTNRKTAREMFGKIKKIRMSVITCRDASLKRKLYAMASFAGLRGYLRLIKLQSV